MHQNVSDSPVFQVRGLRRWGEAEINGKRWRLDMTNLLDNATTRNFKVSSIGQRRDVGGPPAREGRLAEAVVERNFDRDVERQE